MQRRPDTVEQRARERVQLWLMIVSTVLWFVLTYTVATVLDIAHSDRPARVIPLGFAMLVLAALPWLAYRRLVAAEVRRRLRRPGPPR